MQLFRVDRLLRNTQILGDIPDYRSLLISTIHIAWPSILESFLIALVAMVDTIMVGTIGSQAIASVGLTTQPKFIGLAVFISLNVAISAIVARRRGEGDRADANRVLMQALLLTLLLTAVVSTISILFANQIIRFAGSHPETHADAVAYFRIIMGGLICNTISMVINAAQRGSGNTKIAMRTNLVSNSVNVVFNYLLIGGKLGFPRLGVTGAAIATVIGSACACGMSIRSLLHPDHFIFLHGVQHARFERKTLSAIFKIGSSTLAEQIFMRVGFLTYSILVAKLGTIAFATHQIGVNLLTLSFSFGDGLSVAAIAMVGRSLGEQRPDMARLYGGICQRFATLFSAGLAVIFLSLGREIFMLFSRDPQILQYSRTITLFLSIITFLQISAVVFAGCLRGAGDTVYAAIVSLISVTFLRPIFGWLFCYPLGLGLTGAWLGLTADQATRFTLTWLRFRSGRWTRYKI